LQRAVAPHNLAAFCFWKAQDLDVITLWSRSRPWFRGRFRQIHFVDPSMESSAADVELFGSGGHVAIDRGKRLHDQFLFRLMQVERTPRRGGAKSFGGGNTRRRHRACRLANRRQPCLLTNKHWSALKTAHTTANSALC